MRISLFERETGYAFRKSPNFPFGEGIQPFRGKNIMRRKKESPMHQKVQCTF
jgi:hypothetical protein